MRVLCLWLLVGIAMVLTGCSFDLVTETALQDKVRNYLYKYQPTTGSQFVDWARRDLKEYTPHQVYRAIQEEGAFQAEQGHPNVVGVLSFAAQAWTRQNSLTYDAKYWVDLQETAKANVRQPGKLQLWPGTTPVSHQK
jgi:outer membrane lipopolysaccharide assembly protein LptE/RlpB